MTIPFSITGGSNHVAYGSTEFITPGTYRWVVPVGVTSISAVCVGGGGGGGIQAGGGGGGALSYVNNTSVTAGAALSIFVGSGGAAGAAGGISSIRNATPTTLVAAGGGSGNSGNTGGSGGTVLTGTGFAGGAGGSAGAGSRGAAGGGAGGYAGVGGGGGGSANSYTGAAGAGGAGGGGSAPGVSNTNGGQGGGVGVGIGSGPSGSGGTAGGANAGNAGSSDIGSGTPISGQSFGGGGGAAAGTGGVVKIFWTYPGFGASRTFPSTNVIDERDFCAYLISQTRSNTSTIAIPVGTRAGDIAVLFDAASAQSTTAPTTVTPSGFTVVNNATVVNLSNLDSVRSIISYKTLVAADSGSTLTGMNGGDLNSKILLIFRPNQPVISTNSISITVSTPGSQATTGANPSNQTIAMSGLNASLDEVLLYFASYRAGRGTGVATRGATGPTFTEISGLDTDHYIKYGEYSGSDTPVNATISMSASGADFQVLQSFYLLLTQA